MNKKRYILLALILLTMSLGMTAKNKTVQKVYLYGFSASFKDSVVYFTDIQELENVSVAERTGFLYGLDRKRIEKKYLKLKSKYTKKGNFDVRYLKADEFKFNRVIPTQVEEVATETSNDAKKGKKKKK